MRWLCILSLGALAAVLGATPIVRAQRPEFAPALDGVIVQYAIQGPRLPVDENADPRAAPPATDEGFRRLAVPTGKSRESFVAELRADPSVVSVETDAAVYAAAEPNDPYYLQSQSQYLAQISAQQAWDLARGSEKVIVAVIDSGLDIDHEEFAGRIWTNPKDSTANGVDDDGNGCIDDAHGCRFVELTPENKLACGYTSSAPTGEIRDDHGQPGSENHSHGTLVAGIIGASGDNGKGIAGAAWNVMLMPIKVLDCGSFGGLPRGSMFNVAEGIAYARRMGAHIINISIASEAGVEAADNLQLRTEIQRAQDAGIIIVAAAGNHIPGTSQVGPGYPAAYTQFDNLISVGAADRALGWAKYSSYGPSIDFAAPGDDIVGPVRTVLSPLRPYVVGIGGTSLAAPFVTSMFALMRSRNSELQARDYLQIAREAATPAAAAPHGQNWAGAGIVNLGQAVGRVPMTITGAALRDWRDAPAGTEVRATIAGVECGTTTTLALGPVSRYTLRIKSEAEAPGCGGPGKVIQFSVGGFPAQPPASWGERDADLALSGLDVSSTPPPPGPVIVQTLNGGWANIVYLDPPGALPAVLNTLPSPWTNVYRWDPEKPGLDDPGGFRHYSKGVPGFVNDMTTLQRYDAVWVDAGAANAATVNPNPPSGLTVDLKPGWNNFVWTGTSAAVADALRPIAGRYLRVLQYDNAARVWLSYFPGQARFSNDFGGLFKLKVYWIFMTEAASLTMP